MRSKFIHSRPKTAAFRPRICSGRSVFRPQEPLAWFDRLTILRTTLSKVEGLARVGSIVVFIFAFLMSPCGMSYAGEHGGKEHGGKEHGGAATHEHGGKTVKKPAVSDIRSAMKAYVKEKSAETGAFEVYDDKIGKARRLKLMRIHKRVGKTGNYYYSCADFKDLDSGEKIDVDLDVEDTDGQLNVVDVRVHKVDGKERYTYDKNDNRIMVNE